METPDHKEKTTANWMAQPVWKYLLYVAYALPFLGIGFVVARYAVNIPKWDDYDILSFVLRWKGADGFGTHLNLLFTQVNEHKSVLHKLLVLTQVGITGHIDFRWLIAIGDTGLLVLCYLLLRTGRSFSMNLWTFLPVLILIVQPQQHENLLLSEGAVANHFVMVLSLLTVMALTASHKYSFVACMIFFVVSTYTNANGMFVYIPVFLHLLLQKRYKHLFISLGIAAVTLGWYFHDYHQPPAHASLLDSFIVYPLTTIQYYFSFCGSFLYFTSLQLVAGVILLAAFLLLLFRFRFHRQNPALFWFLVFLHLTAVVTAIGRAGMGAEQALVSRYRIYSALIAAITLMAYLQLADGKPFYTRVWWVSLSAVLLFSCWSWSVPMGVIQDEHDRLDKGFASWLRKNPDLQYREGMDNSDLFYYVEDYKSTLFRTLPDAFQDGCYKWP